ncbi:phosphodiester glycosidase family protein [Oceanithermus sp.]
MRRLLACLVFLLLAAWAQVPAAWLGLSVYEEDGALVFAREGVRFSYVPGLGWTSPLDPALPPPLGDDYRLDERVLRAAGVVPADLPSARLRYRLTDHSLRLVLDLPPGEPPELPREEGESPGWFTFFAPYFVSNPPRLPGLSFVYGERGTEIRYLAPEGRSYRWRVFPLAAPARFVMDAYFVPPPEETPLAGGIVLRREYVWTPEPLELVRVIAAAGSWRLEPVGRPGVRQKLPQMAPEALALLNGGYYDPKTATPIGLWVRDGVPLSYPYGRSALMWDGGLPQAAIPRFKAWVRTPDGRAHPVGVNSWPARLTAYTIPGRVGRTGENVIIVAGDEVLHTYPAPVELKAGRWALAYPAGDPYWSGRLRPGDRLSLYGALEPPVRYALEAGPLLVQGGHLAYAPELERFAAGSPQISKVTNQAAVAWTREGELWLVTSGPTTPGVLAERLLALGAWGAIRMDAGGSAQLYAGGRLVFPGRERPVVSGLALYPR